MEDLQIKVQAIIDEVTSLLGMQSALQKMGAKLNIPVTAKLDKAKSRQQLKADLATLESLSVKLTGKLNKTESRKALKTDVKSLENEKIKLKATVDTKSVKKSLADVKGASVNVDVDGAENVQKLQEGMDGINRVAPSAVGNVILLNKAISALERAAREMVETAAELDEKLTDLRMVTGASYDDAKALVDSYNDLAKELGATTAEVLDASSEWLRQGMSTQETAQLIEQSMILSKVGAMDAATATENLTSAMKGYGLAVEDVSGIVDKLTAIDLQAAVSASDLAVGMSRTATSADIAGVSMDRLLGYLAVVQETTQKSAETVGESFKTIFARIGNVKLGNYLSDDGEDLSDVETVLKHFGIALRDAQGDFRNTMDVLDEVYAQWDKFSGVDKRAVANAFAGTRQQENFLVLMENYGKALEYTEVAANSAGTALEKFGAYQESLQAKMNGLTAAFESLSMNTLDADFLGALIEAGTALLQFADNLNLVKIALAGLGAAGVVKGFTALSGHIKNAYESVAKLSAAFNMLDYAADVGLNAQQFSELLSVTNGLNTSQLRLIVTNKALTNEQRLALLTASGLTAEEAAQTLATMGLSTAEATATTATFSLSGAFKALTAAIAANPIGFLVVALTTAVTIISTVADKVRQANEEARQAALETAEAARDEIDAINDLVSTYNIANSAYASNVGSKEDLEAATDALLAKLGVERSEISSLVEEYGNLDKALHSITADALKSKWSDLLSGLRAAEDDLLAQTQGAWYSSYNLISGQGAKTAEILSRAGLISDSSYNTDFAVYLGDNESVDGVLEMYDKLLTMDKVLTDAVANGELSSDFLKDDDFYSQVKNKINDMAEYVEAYKQYIADMNEIAAQIQIEEYLSAADAPTNANEYIAFRDAMYEQSSNNELFYGGYQDRINAIDSYMQDAFATIYDAYTDNQAKIDKLVEGMIPKDYEQYDEGTSAHFNELDAWLTEADAVKEKLRGLSDEDFEIVYNLVFDEGMTNWEDVEDRINAMKLGSFISEEDIKAAKQNVRQYKAILNEAAQANVDVNKTVYGNIDTNSRQILEWTEENLERFKKAYQSWGYEAEDLKNSFSTVMGTSGEYNGVEIAFSPMLQTEDGAVLLDRDTVDEYIWWLFDKALEDGTWDSEELFRLDTEGLEFDGVLIKNLLAGIGDAAIQAGEAMHFVGDTGAISDAYGAIDEIAQKYGMTVEQVVSYTEYLDRVSEQKAESIRKSIKSLWNSDDFEDTKEDILALANTVNGITADSIKELAEESTTLAAVLDEDGMSAEFLASVLQSVAEGNDGFELITADALKLNEALEGMSAKFESVTEAKERYDAAMSVDEKDTDFKSYAEAFEELNKQFEAGTTNSNAFWAAAEFLFGSEQLAAWGWSDGLDEIYSAMEKNRIVFEDADNAGAGFIERLYQMSQAGQLVNDQGEKLLKISKNSDGAYVFDIDPDNIDAIAEKMGITTDAALACLKALSMWGDIDFYDIREVSEVIDEIGLSAEKAGKKAINISALTDQLITLGKNDKEITDVIKALRELDGVVLLDAEGEVNDLTESLTNLGLAADDGVTVKVDAEGLSTLLSNLNFTKEQAEDLITKLGEADGITLTNSQGEIKDTTAALEYLNGLDFATVTSNVDGVGEAVENVDGETTDNLVGQFNNIETAAGDAETAIGRVQTAVQHLDGQTAVVTIDMKRKQGILSSIFGSYASGTSSAPAGKALVGEEGAELIQSGNRAYLAGVGGAEVVDLKQGDRVYTADETKRIVHGSGRQLRGIIPAYKDGTPKGRAKSGELYVQTNKTGTTGTPVTLNATVEAEIDDKTLEEQLKDTLDELEEELSDIIGNFEHSIFLLEKNDGTPEQIIAIYQKMQETVHAQAEKYRALGLDETSDYIQALQKKWWEYKETIEDMQHEVYKTVVENYSNTLSLLENRYEVLENRQYKDDMTKNLYQQLEVQKKIQEEAHKEADRLREMGLDENDEAIQECISAWWSAEKDIEDINSKIADNVLGVYDEFIDHADEFDLWKNFNFTKVEYLKKKLKEINRLFAEGVLTLKDYNSLIQETGVEIYNEQKDALTEIIEKTMELVRQEADDQVDALEDQIDAYRKIIELKKEALSATKDEEDYQTEVAKKTAEIAEKQAKLAQLDRDTSRATNAEKQTLAQELAELQQELAEYQADYAYDAQVDALDKEADAFEDTKNTEISRVKSTVDTEEKVYNAAISRINSNWEQLYDDLIAWNKQYGDMIDGEDSITSAWRTAKEAAQEYGDVVSALNGINSSASYAGKNTDDKQTQIDSILSRMQANGKSWHTAATQEEKNRLVRENEELAEKLSALLGRKVVKVNGAWYLDSASGPRLFHTGLEQGYVGGKGRGSDEVLAVLRGDEAVLSHGDANQIYNRFNDYDNFVDGMVSRLASTSNSTERVVESITNNSSTDNSSEYAQNVNIENTFNMQDMSPYKMKQAAEYYADFTIGKLNGASHRKGLKNKVGNAMLKG